MRVGRGTDTQMTSLPGNKEPGVVPGRGTSRPGRWLECAGIAVCLLLLTGGPVPGVNEAHYLSQARHYWDSTWCEGDFFLESPDAHHVFFWVVGWLTTWLSLPAVAWVGRVAAALVFSVGLARLCWSFDRRPGIALLFATLYVTLVTWTQMAGEWVVGGVEAKVFAYGFLFFGLAEMAQGRWRRVWLWTGSAAAFHVLVGGWATLAALGTWMASRDRLPLRQMWPWLIAGGVLSLPGLLPALALGQGVDSEVAAAAHMIYVYERLSHHLLVSRFEIALVVRHVAAVLVVGILVVGLRAWTCGRVRRICMFAGGAVIIALVGGLLDLALGRGELEAGILRFYWFRLSDAIVPLIAALLLLQWAVKFKQYSHTISRVVLGACLLMVLANAAWTLGQRLSDPRPDADRLTLPGNHSTAQRRNEIHRQWRNTCQWIRENTDRNAIFLTPRMHQTFKWYAERGEVVNWKNVPQGSGALVEWWRRVNELIPVQGDGFGSMETEQLQQTMRRYNADYVVLAHDSRFRSSRLPGPLERVYPEDDGVYDRFEVYRLESR